MVKTRQLALKVVTSLSKQIIANYQPVHRSINCIWIQNHLKLQIWISNNLSCLLWTSSLRFDIRMMWSSLTVNLTILGHIQAKTSLTRTPEAMVMLTLKEVTPVHQMCRLNLDRLRLVLYSQILLNLMSLWAISNTINVFRIKMANPKYAYR